MWNFLSHCWRNARTIILRVTGDSERLSPLRLGRFRSCSTSTRQDRMESVLFFFPTYDFPSSLVSAPPALLGLSIPLIFPGRCNSPPLWPIRFPDSLVSVFLRGRTGRETAPPRYKCRGSPNERWILSSFKSDTPYPTLFQHAARYTTCHTHFIYYSLYVDMCYHRPEIALGVASRRSQEPRGRQGYVRGIL